VRTFKSLLLIWIGLSLIGPTTALSQKARDSLKQNNQTNPVEIQSDKLQSVNEGKKIIFTGNVVSTWADLEIRSDTLEVYANPKSKVARKKSAADVNQARQDLDKIIAIGNVDIKKGDRRAKGDRAVYDNKKQIIIITGEPHATAWEAENIIKGGKMTFFLERDLFEVNDRVRLVLFPKTPPPEKER
jgi:lipopolysaccharide transport protein LptA